jgi:16S rRNA (guanine1516-N2)-methyltransferase
VPIADFVVAVLPATIGDAAEAGALAQRLGLPLLPAGTDVAGDPGCDAVLWVSGTGRSLQLTGPRPPGPVAVDFGAGRMRHRRRGGANELLGRAVGVGKLQEVAVLDATAGLGQDAFVLADLGCEVLLCERNPLIAELLAAGLAAAQGSGDPWLVEAAARMRLSAGDARTRYPAPTVDVIYLDPMFAGSRRGAARKEMALFQRLLGGPEQEGDELLAWALRADVARVVVKRALRAPDLGGIAPTHCIRGRAVRYDVHVRRALS